MKPNTMRRRRPRQFCSRLTPAERALEKERRKQLYALRRAAACAPSTTAPPMDGGPKAPLLATKCASKPDRETIRAENKQRRESAQLDRAAERALRKAERKAFRDKGRVAWEAANARREAVREKERAKEKAERDLEHHAELEAAVGAERALRQMEREAEREGLECLVHAVREATAKARWEHTFQWSVPVLLKARRICDRGEKTLY